MSNVSLVFGKSKCPYVLKYSADDRKIVQWVIDFHMSQTPKQVFSLLKSKHNAPKFEWLFFFQTSESDLINYRFYSSQDFSFILER